MSDELHSEDLTILAALEALGTETAASGAIPRAGADEASDTLARLYVETLGLLPYELEPIAPRPEVEEALFAAILGEETQDVVAQEEAGEATQDVAPEGREAFLAEEPEPGSTKEVPPAARGAEAAPGKGRARLIPMPPPSARAAVQRRRWPTALAATLILGLLGLAAYLEIQVQEGKGTIADLQGEMAALKEQAQAVTAEANRSQLDISDLREKFKIVTSPASEVRPLRPDEKGPLQPAASGVLFVSADHQHWYLVLRNLQPAEGQKAYVIWFINEQGPVNGGWVSPRSGALAELTAKQMPAGTTDVRVTLEANPHVASPAGPLVLKAATSVAL